MQLPDSRKRQAGPEGEEPLTGTHVPGPYMGRHCERNRVPHERYILPSQPTAPFRDLAFHIAAVSPLVPIPPIAIGSRAPLHASSIAALPPQRGFFLFFLSAKEKRSRFSDPVILFCLS